LISWNVVIVYIFFALSLFVFNSSICQVKLEQLFADLTRQAILDEINPIRTEGGYFELRSNAKLNQAAQMKADDMVKKGYFSHIGPDGAEPWIWFENAGYDYAAAGENLAVNYFSANELVDAWRNSPAHAQNLLNGYFNDVGIGIAKGDIQGKGETQIVVMFLGREITPEIRSMVGATLATSASDKNISQIPPERPIMESIVDEKVIKEERQKEQKVLSSFQKIEKNYSRKIQSRMALADFLTYELRLMATIFFLMITAWAFASMAAHKEKYLSIRFLRPFVILFLAVFIWLPELLH